MDPYGISKHWHHILHINKINKLKEALTPYSTGEALTVKSNHQVNNGWLIYIFENGHLVSFKLRQREGEREEGGGGGVVDMCKK